MSVDPRITHSLSALKAALEQYARTPDESASAWADSLLNHVEAIEEALAGGETA
jgi:hypothetical protein